MTGTSTEKRRWVAVALSLWLSHCFFDDYSDENASTPVGASSDTNSNTNTNTNTNNANGNTAETEFDIVALDSRAYTIVSTRTLDADGADTGLDTYDLIR
ncbi:MAG: hypothetical protein AAFY60_07600, partial [Myxococcota bacterium]